MQSDGFQHRRIKQREIHAGAELLLHNRVAKADALSDCFKTGGRYAVDDILLLQRSVNRSRLFQHAVGIIALIGVERRVPCPFAEQLGGACSDLGDDRMIRRNKGAQQFGIKRNAVPLVEGQGCNFGLLAAKRLFSADKRYGQHAGYSFRHACEVVAVGNDFDVIQR